MTNFKKLICSLMLSCALSWAGEPVIIVNKTNPMTEISRSQLKKLMLGKVAKWPTGTSVSVFIGPAGQAERKVAIQRFCGMNEADYNTAFLQASFKGETLNQPKTMPSTQSVHQVVQLMPGAIGIVSSADVTPAVKVIPLTAE